MTRQSNSGIDSFKEATATAKKQLVEGLKQISFELKSSEQKIKEIVEETGEIPGRVTPENVLQEQWSYKSQTGYIVEVHTGMIGEEFSEKGSAWVMVLDPKKLNEDGKPTKVFVREFYKHLGFTLIKRLLVYSKLARKIADSRMDGFDLVETKETKMEWKKGSQTKLFSIKYYLAGFSPKERSLMLQTEGAWRRYRERTEGKVRRERDFRSTWGGKKKK